MGMYLALAAVDDVTIKTILADPPLVWKVIAPDDPDMYEAARSTGGGSWFSKMFGKKELHGDVEISRPVEEADLDKAWHAIHYLLTGTAWEGEPPLNFLLRGGSEIGDIDVGYGTARAVDASAVKEINAALAELSEETLKNRFIPAEMMELQIYPEIWDRNPEEEDLFGYCIENFSDLKGFVGRAAENGLGIVISIQ
jgi:hypothetical protein